MRFDHGQKFNQMFFMHPPPYSFCLQILNEEFPNLIWNETTRSVQEESFDKDTGTHQSRELSRIFLETLLESGTIVIECDQPDSVEADKLHGIFSRLKLETRTEEKICRSVFSYKELGTMGMSLINQIHASLSREEIFQNQLTPPLGNPPLLPNEFVLHIQSRFPEFTWIQNPLGVFIGSNRGSLELRVDKTYFVSLLAPLAPSSQTEQILFKLGQEIKRLKQG